MNEPDHTAENRRYWDNMAAEWVAGGERQWRRQEPIWGIWELAESELGLLPADMTGMDAVELGCGTGYVAGWMARRGARVVGIDNSMQQLRTAARLSAEYTADVALVHGDAERVPLSESSFDFAISEYGAAIWCEPIAWLREAHRLLRPGGQLTLIANHPVVMACSPVDGSNVVKGELVRSYFDLGRLDWREVEIDPGGMEFCPSLSEWVAVFRRVGFIVDELLEPRAPDDADGISFFVEASWAKRWPSELVWKVHKN